MGTPANAVFFNLSSFTIIDKDGICLTCDVLNLGNVLFDSGTSLLAGTITGSYVKNSKQRTFDLTYADPAATFNFTQTGGNPDPKIISGT
ncbi:MAG: hypothetical protein NTX45_22470 [Proteobacteria bacterium]|nr:hypothetical protein [Pseudomonadota bacterium]